MDELKWFQKPMVLSAVQCNYGEDSFQIMKTHVLANGFNGEQLFHLNAEGHVSFYDEKRDGKKLDAYLKEAKQNGLIEILYWNVHCVYPVTRAIHPEWIQKDKKGGDIKAYGSQYLICINTPWAEEYHRNLEKLCTHPIDGIFLDGPVFLHNSCYCPHCRLKFREEYGMEMEEAEYADFLRFRVDSITRMVKKTHETVKAINPDIMLYLNNSALRADVTGSNTEKLYPYVDFLGTEGGFVWINKTFDYMHTTSHAKYIAQKAKGKPYFIFIAGDYKPSAYCMHTAEETKRLYALSLANGANIWYGIHAPTEVMDTPGGRAAADLNRFILDKQEYFTLTKSYSKAAILWSNTTANFYASSVAKSDFTEGRDIGTDRDKGNHHHSFLGFYDMLTRSHIQFDVLDTEAVKDGRIRDYELLVLPTYACMDEEEAGLFRTYVEEGGNIIASFDTGLYDGKGEKLEQGRLDGLFGIHRKALVHYNDHGIGYTRLLEDEEEKIVIFGGKAWELEAAGDVLAENLVPMAGRYEDFPRDSYPYIVENKTGKGKTVFISGTMGEYYNEWASPDHRQWFEKTVNRLCDVLVHTDAPPAVEFTLRRQKNRLLLHVVNMVGGPSRPMETTVPVHDIHVEISGLKGVREVKGIVTDSTYACRETPVGTSITIPMLMEYEIIVIEQED
ncbi:MAG: beta-galactosidase trimerization domain-containing protein [Clostridia bacterium]